ncbi:hypothetical protein UFOVP844_34 [uncultured Caudovirales phage]|mgnify:CR=1 FL=1|uniref:Uncharacterized protein n=1 Tax=uncultured Caudovirales phage TaxID=2100421 RepID=A0A6J5PBQ4_9CAUD|nr:hypothetical protein UFOVP844_34 [uncultured Caudovirales phage]
MSNSKIIAISPLPPEVTYVLNCRLLHSQIPKRTDKGIIWVCKEGCSAKKLNKEKQNDPHITRQLETDV